MCSTLTLLLLQGLLRFGVVEPHKILSMGQIELFNIGTRVETNDWCLIATVTFLEATPYKEPTVLPPTSHHENYQS